MIGHRRDDESKGCEKQKTREGNAEGNGSQAGQQADRRTETDKDRQNQTRTAGKTKDCEGRGRKPKHVKEMGRKKL